MFKIRVAVFDLTYGAKEWIEKFCNEDHMEVCEYITMDEDSQIQITELPQYDNWDYLFVFEMGFRDMVKELLTRLVIPEEKIIYPLDMETTLPENYSIYMYLFKDMAYRLAKYRSFREDGEKYVVASTDNLYFMNLSSDDSILPTTYLGGDVWAQDEMRLFHELSNKYFEFDDKQDLFCDIGANIGTTCIYFRRNLDSKVSILAFEPSQENYKMLQINAILNDISMSENTFVPMGLSDETAEGIITFNPDNPGGSSLLNNGVGKQEKILLTTFDDYLEQAGIDPSRIKYLWVDVEGYEARFLKGAEKTMARINAPVFMEFIPKFYKNKSEEFDLLMKEIEKHFVSFICAQFPQEGKIPVKRLWEEQDNENISWDLFFLKE